MPLIRCNKSARLRTGISNTDTNDKNVKVMMLIMIIIIKKFNNDDSNDSNNNNNFVCNLFTKTKSS